MKGEGEGGSRQKKLLAEILPPLFVGFMLILCGFLAGWYWEEASIQEPLRLEIVQGKELPRAQSQSIPEAELTESTETTTSETCAFVGSKNSDQYHAPDSGSAKRIKEENTLCFESKEAAEAEGYKPGDVE